MSKPISAREAVERLADKHLLEGECPPEDLLPNRHPSRCKPGDDCHKCWVNTVTRFLEIEDCEQ